jgi:hypothetical protein
MAPNSGAGDFSACQQAESQWLLNEFISLRQEFVERFPTENLLVLAALTLLGTIGGIAFKDATQTNSEILLIVPTALPIIGFFYLNQRLSNTMIGLYVRDNLRTRVGGLLKTDVLEWEQYVRSNSPRTSLKELTALLVTLCVFVVPNIAALVFTFPMLRSVHVSLEHFAWWSGAILSVLWTFSWVAGFYKWAGRRR